MKTEIQLTNGETFALDGQYVKKVTVKSNGWVKVNYRENGDIDYDAHIPPQRIKQILGNVVYESEQ